jgi:membrane protein
MATTQDHSSSEPAQLEQPGSFDRGWIWIQESSPWLLGRWAVRGFRESEAGHLAAIIAFNGIVALVPTTLLLATALGLLIRQEEALVAISRAAYWALPAHDAREALDAALQARRYTGWLGIISLAAFLWIGTNFVTALSHCFNRVYNAADLDFVCTRRRGFIVIVIFSMLFTIASLAATIPTLFIGRHLNPYFRTWFLAGTSGKIAGYLLSLVAATLLFLILYRVVPTAGQRWRDVWIGSIVAASLFVLLGQVFPLYLRFAGGTNRFGAALGLVWLLLTWFAVLAHVLLFGCYINATHQKRRWRRAWEADMR